LRGGATGSGAQVGELAHEFARFADAGFGFAGAGFRPVAEPLDFSVDQILQRFLTAGLRVQEFFFLL